MEEWNGSVSFHEQWLPLFLNVHLCFMTKSKRGKSGGEEGVSFNQSWSKSQVLLSDLIAVGKELHEERELDRKEAYFKHKIQFQAASHCNDGLINIVRLTSVVCGRNPGILASIVFLWLNKARFRVVFIFILFFFTYNANIFRLNYYMPLWF